MPPVDITGAITGRKRRVTAAPVKPASGPPIPNEIVPTPHAEPKAARRARVPPIRGPPIERMTYSIPEFCEAHRISIDTYFRMQRAGTGPEIMKAGHRTLISVEAAAAWREAGRKAAARERV
jgi:hypothetical protein